MSTIAPKTSFSGPVVSLDNFLFDYPGADIVLRSGDSYKFRVLSIYIFHSSPVLRDRVTATRPQPGATISADTTVPSLPIVQLSISGAVLFSLLTYIFPVQPILPSTVDHTIKLLWAAQRYEMDAILTHIRNHIARQDPPLIREENSLLVFSLAHKHGLRREALQAARSTLRLPTFTIESLEERLEMMPIASLHALWKYRQGIRKEFASPPLSFPKYLSASSSHETPKSSVHLGCTHQATSGIPDWLDRYISSIGTNPSFFHLSTFHRLLRDHVRSSSNVNCRRCYHCATTDIPALWAYLSTIYNKSITNAESDLPLLPGDASFTLHTKKAGERLGKRAGTSQHRHSNMPNADIVLRSCDLVDFRVNRSALVASSPLFGDVFSLPQSSDNEVVDGLPLVRFPEDASVLNSLISVLYPVSPEIPDSDDQVLTLLATCQKYDMTTVQSSIRAEVSRRGLLSPTGAESFRVFAVACRKGLIPEMEAAALLTLDYPMTFEFLGDALRSFEPWALRKLARFHQYCRISLLSCLRLSWIKLGTSHKGSSEPHVWVGCPKAGGALPGWLSNIFLTKFPKLTTFDCPLPFVKPSSFREEYLVALQAHVRENDCSFCMKVHILKGEEFCAEIEKKLAQAWDIQYVSRDELPGVRPYTTFRRDPLFYQSDYR